MIIADTDVLIDYLAGRRPAAEAVSRALLQDQLQTTTLNGFELLAGVRGNKQRESVLALLERKLRNKEVICEKKFTGHVEIWAWRMKFDRYSGISSATAWMPCSLAVVSNCTSHPATVMAAYPACA